MSADAKRAVVSADATQGTAFDNVDPPDAALIAKCVHCGFCLPSCPTYVLWGEEMDSPRGRIYLMQAGLDQRTDMSASYVRHFDACLGCMACVTACPSGVQYSPLIEATRGQIERRHERPLADRLFRAAIFALFPYPARLRVALAPLAAWTSIVGRRSPAANRISNPESRVPSPDSRLPTADSRVPTPDSRVPSLVARVRAMLELAPPVTWRGLTSRAPEHTSAAGERRMTVGVLTGCVQRLAFPAVNEATVRVLAAEGCDVVAPRAQGCCGALALHAGRLDEARAFARRTIEVFEAASVERIAVNAAGCGSSMKEYGQLLADDPAWAERARAFAARVADISELLAELGEPRAPRHPMKMRVAYHDACHLAHAQGIRQQPRDLLRSIPGLELLPFAEQEICCGSAGIYNLVEPQAARDLGDRKIARIAETAPAIVATGNPGCTLQLAAAARRAGKPLVIRHPIELVDASIRNVAP
jgi:glycolate oxidase iron-sulfur subunit